jgi:glycosyltransferase involved in cell wall biosynthesis
MDRAPVYFLIPGDPDTPTGGFVYGRHAVRGLAEAGRLGAVVRIDGPFPATDSDTLARAALAIAAIPDNAIVVVDGLGFAPLIEVIQPHAHRFTVVALIHHPLGDETGLDADERARWLRDEVAALAITRRVITTSRTTATRLVDLGIDQSLLHAVPPGVDEPVDLAFRETRLSDGPLRLLTVATLVPRKGQDLLVGALAHLADRQWSADFVGDPRNPDYARRLADQIAESRLGTRIALHGAVSPDRLEPFWRRADLFVLPSRYEGWGIAFVEAVRWGLPVIGTTAAAIPEAVPSEAAILVPPDDLGELTAALARILDDPAERKRLSDGAIHAAAGLRRWSDTAAEFTIAATEGL